MLISTSESVSTSFSTASTSLMSSRSPFLQHVCAHVRLFLHRCLHSWAGACDWPATSWSATVGAGPPAAEALSSHELFAMC